MVGGGDGDLFWVFEEAVAFGPMRAGVFVVVVVVVSNPLGLSLISLWSICVAPVRGGTHFLCRRKESKQRKRAHTGGL